jgi:GIY-YIG catalytic domain
MITESDIEAVERVTSMHAVYRMWSAAGALLYVGVTGNLAKRLDGHAEKRWYPLVATITLEWFPTRDAAEVAEAQAIVTEHPRVNIAGRSAKAPSAPRLAGWPDGPVSLAEAVGLRILTCTLGAARKAAGRPGFPEPVGRRQDKANLYDVDALCAYKQSRGKR